METETPQPGAFGLRLRSGRSATKTSTGDETARGGEARTT